MALPTPPRVKRHMERNTNRHEEREAALRKKRKAAIAKKMLDKQAERRHREWAKQNRELLYSPTIPEGSSSTVQVKIDGELITVAEVSDWVVR